MTLIITFLKYLICFFFTEKNMVEITMNSLAMQKKELEKRVWDQEKRVRQSIEDIQVSLFVMLELFGDSE